MTYLVTGAAGFIGFHVARALVRRGARVIGIDDLNDYYAPALKQARLDAIEAEGGDFRFAHVDIAGLQAIETALAGEPVRRIIHLAAQAGVRYAFENPTAYARANLLGHTAMLEYARRLDGLEGMTYASSSSVYGNNAKVPFAETDRVDHPISFYAATKRANELMSEAHARLYGLPLTGLRFFTVYGPWGRPDMAMWIFTEKISEGAPITVFSGGALKRDFTYIDDIVDTVIAAADRPAQPDENGVPHRLYNLGNEHPENVNDLIALLEQAIGRRARREEVGAQPGDVEATYAAIGRARADFGFSPRTSLAEGVPRFVDWYRRHGHLARAR